MLSFFDIFQLLKSVENIIVVCFISLLYWNRYRYR